MIPISLEELKAYDGGSLFIVIPEHLKHSLIGPLIEGTEYFQVLDGDPTKSGYSLLDAGTPLERKIYKTLHTPDILESNIFTKHLDGTEHWLPGKVQYRKLNHLVYGDCWEKVPEGE